MARPIWKGNISFGLVNIPVVLQSAERSGKQLRFKLLDSRDQAGIQYQRINEQTGEEVPWEKIVKGYEFEDGNYVLLTNRDFKKAAVEATQTVEILDFVNITEIDMVYFDKPYYLVPDKKGEKGYVLLREILTRTGRVGIGKVVIRTREHLAAVVPMDDVLVLDLLRFQHELVDIDTLDLPAGGLKKYKITDKEIEMAGKLVAAMSSTWKPEKYHDDYYEALMKYIKAKAKSGDVQVPVDTPEEDDDRRGIINIMDLLKKSVEQTGGKRKSRSRGSGRPSELPRRKRA